MPKKTVAEFHAAVAAGETIRLTGADSLAEALVAEKQELADELDARIRAAGGPEAADLAEIIAHDVVIGLARKAGLSGVTDKGGTTLMAHAQKARRAIEREHAKRSGFKVLQPLTGADMTPVAPVQPKVVEPAQPEPTLPGIVRVIATDAETFKVGNWVPIFDGTMHLIARVGSPKMARMVCGMPEKPHFDLVDAEPPAGQTKLCQECSDGSTLQPTPQQTGSVVKPAAKANAPKRERQKVEPAKVAPSTDPKHKRVPAAPQTTPRRVAVRVQEGADPWQLHTVAVTRVWHDGYLTSISHLTRAGGGSRCGLPLSTPNAWTVIDNAPVICTNCRKTLGLLPISWAEVAEFADPHIAGRANDPEPKAKRKAA